MIEVWKTYPEYPWIEGSSLGRLRTIDRFVRGGRGGKRPVKGHAIKQRHNKYGYMCVGIGINGRVVHRLVHRIIAECFLQNKDNLPQINHKNCIRDDNRVDNLEWCDASYNCRYKEKHGKALGHPVYAVNLKTLAVSKFRSQSESSRELGINGQDINAILKGRGNHNTAKGYWFTEDGNRAAEITKSELRGIVTMKRWQGRPIFAINLETLEVLRFQSQAEASRELGIGIGNINSVIKDRLRQTGGYWFTYDNENAVESTRAKFGNEVADKVEQLVNEKELQLA